MVPGICRSQFPLLPRRPFFKIYTVIAMYYLNMNIIGGIYYNGHAY